MMTGVPSVLGVGSRTHPAAPVTLIGTTCLQPPVTIRHHEREHSAVLTPPHSLCQLLFVENNRLSASAAFETSVGVERNCWWL